MSNTNIQTQLKPVRRACGWRKAGGIYLSTLALDIGAPIEYFLVDPPCVIYPEEFGISAQGMKLVEASWRGKPGVYDIFDWVGKEHYPYVPDFVEEARFFGTSRRVQSNFEFDKITDETRHFYLHPRAYIADPTQLWENYIGIAGCPKRSPLHTPREAIETCIGLLWEAVDHTDNEDIRVHTVHMPCGKNYAAAAALREWNLEFQLAIFMWTKPTKIEIVMDEQDRHRKALELLDKLGTGIPYEIVEE